VDDDFHRHVSQVKSQVLQLMQLTGDCSGNSGSEYRNHRAALVLQSALASLERAIRVRLQTCGI
jgi:hypothetical protein